MPIEIIFVELVQIELCRCPPISRLRLQFLDIGRRNIFFAHAMASASIDAQLEKFPESVWAPA